MTGRSIELPDLVIVMLHGISLAWKRSYLKGLTTTTASAHAYGLPVGESWSELGFRGRLGDGQR